MHDFNFEFSTWKDFSARLEAELEVTFPTLRRRVDFLSLPKADPLRHGEYPMACLARVQRSIHIAGVGTKKGLTLSYDALAITVFMACLPPAMQQDIYREFKRWDVTLSKM